MNIIINLNKPENISSQQAVLEVKKILAVKKAGHAGTLDPLATGVLLVCLNEATKITGFLSDLDKAYMVKLKLGVQTDTYDSSGKILEERDYRLVHEEDMRDDLKKFTGFIEQIPPMYSAIKVNGKPLYKSARKGLSIARPARTVHIKTIDLISFQPPYVNLRVACSKGTYIRTLCDDIGKLLGTGAHMTALQRTRTGNFRIEDAITIQELRGEKYSFYSIDTALSHLPEIVLGDAVYKRALNGVPISFSDISLIDFRQYAMHQHIRLKSPDNVLFGIGKVEHTSIRIERLLNVLGKS